MTGLNIIVTFGAVENVGLHTGLPKLILAEAAMPL